MAGKFMGSKDFYKDSPKLERGEDGKMGVHKKEQSKDTKEDESAGHEGEPVHVEKEGDEEKENVHARHNLARHHLHAQHEMEHAMHKGHDKTEMHAKHIKEHSDMLKNHDKELAGINENEGAEPGAGE